MRARPLRHAAAATVLVLFALSPTRARAQFPITESFTGSSAPGWTLMGSAVLTANGHGDAAGSGWLRLTDATTNQAGTAYYDTAFPSTSGIVATFDYADYGGTHADGFSFFLIDGTTATPTVGSSGGPLGYAAKVGGGSCSAGPQTVLSPSGSVTYQGVTNGFVGIGFDEYGNFSNCEAGYNSPGLRPQAVVIRGAGSSGTGSQTAFRYLAGVTPGFSVDGVARTSPRRVRISIINQKITVELDLTGTGSAYQTLISSYDLAAAPGQTGWSWGGTMPATFKMGISGSTGGSTNTHEIRNVRIEKPVRMTLSQTASPAATMLVGDTLTYTITIANDATNDATGTSITDHFPAGLTGVHWTCTATGGASLPAMSGSGDLVAGSATLPPSSSLTCVVTGQAAASALGTTLTNEVDVAPPAGSANLLSSTSNTAVVVAYPTATALASSVSPTVYGQSTTLTATTTVTSGSSTPAGSVTFLDGATALGTAALNGSGVATLTVNGLDAGSHALQAQYAGTASYWPSASPTLTQTVNPAATTTAVTTSGTPALVGQPVTFTAQVAPVAPGGFVPAGTVAFYDGASLLGTGTLDGSGRAGVTVSTLTLGAHGVTGRYSGAARHLASTSAALSQSVVQASTTTALTASPSPAVFGQSVVLSAAVAPVAPAAGTPGGQVQFYEGAALLGTIDLTVGVAQLTVLLPTAGLHGYQAVYLGSASYATSTSPGLSLTVNQASTAVALGASANPSVTGQPVTFTATVSAVAPGGGVPTGTVELRDAGALLASKSLAGGAATFTLSSLAVGTHSLTVNYLGDANHLAGASAALAQRVNAAATTTTVTSAPAPSVFGQAVTFTATVAVAAPGAGAPTGTVTFSDGATLLGAGTLAGGNATFTTSALGAGTHTITATYGGDASFAGSSGARAQSVSTAATSTALAAAPEPTVTGQLVTLTATVTTAPGAGTATGQVAFADGATVLGVAALDASGTASLTTGALGVGARSLTAAYAGDANHAGSSSAAVAHTVGAALSATALAASPGPSVTGQAVTFTASVTAVAPGAGTPDGTVTFLEGGATLGTGTLDAGGSAALVLASLSPGPHGVVARYEGSARFTGSASAALAQTVNPAGSVTVLVAPASSAYGQAVTLTATVTAAAPGAGTPAGAVTFSDGGLTLGTAPLDGAGVASLTTSSLAVGGHALGAAYGGSAGYLAGSASGVSLTVNPAATTTALVASADPTVVGQPVTLTATVAAASGGTPGGAVTFRDGATSLGTVTLDAAGQASLAVSTLTAGAHALGATYGGAASFATSASPALAHTVAAAPTAVALSAGPSPAAFGEAVQLVATVTAVAPGAGVPDGAVAFFDGASPLGTSALDAAGVARLSVASLAVGGHALAGAYQGSPSYRASAGGPVAAQVVQAGTAVAVSSSLPTSTYGDEVTLTAAVSPVAPGAGVPTGTVTFLVDGAPVGTGTLSAGVATLRTGALPAGVLDVTAVYAGDASFAGCSGGGFTQLVSRAALTVNLASSANPVALGEPLTLTATVAGPAGAPGGTVTFRDGATVLCQDVPLSAGAATCAPALGVGPHSLTAAASGDANHAPGTSAALAQTVTTAASATALAAAPATSVFGQAVTLTATVTPAGAGAGAPGGTVTFQEGANVLGTAALDAGGVARLTLSTAAVGGHAVTAAYGGDARYASSASGAASFTVSVAATATALAASAAAPEAGQPVTLTATVTVTAPGAATPGGTVTFKDGGASLGTGAVGAGGVATLAVSGLDAGAHALTAEYAGDAHLAGSASAPLSLTVSVAATATALAAEKSPVVYGEPAVLDVTVTVPGPGSGTPAGTVTVEEAGAVLGTATIAAGAAQITLTGLEPGPHTLLARFPGDARLGASASAAVTLQVNPAATRVTLAAAPSPVSHGEEATLTATVAAVAPGGGIPAGTVTFADGGAPLGSAALDAAGHATFTTRSLAVGAHTLTAAYAGSARHQASTSAATPLTVERDPVTLALASSRNPSRHGRAVTLTVTATAAGGTPDGAITLRDGDAVLARLTLAGGAASFTTRDLGRGTHAIAADYAGAAAFAPATATLAGGEVVENSPPVAGGGWALALGSGGALRARLPAPVADSPARGTVELWVNPGWRQADEVGPAPSILTLGPADALRLALGLSPDRRALAVTLGAVTSQVPAALDDGLWHHVAVRSDGQVTAVLVDGAPVASLDGGLGAGAPGELVLGEGFTGALDELRIWSSARSTDDLAAARWRILHGDEAGLAGLWRFDEGSGAEAFDAGPAHLDGALDLDDGGVGFTPSGMWQRFVLPDDHALHLDAGYDPDGDPLTVTLGEPPALGTFGRDGDLGLRYDAPAAGEGLAQLSWSVSDGTASAAATAGVDVIAPIACEAVSTCPSGDLCMSGFCTAPEKVVARSGAGCGAGPAGAGAAWALVALLALALRRPRRALALRRAGRTGAALLVLLLAAGAAAARAQTPQGFALQTLEPSPPGDRFFSLPDADTGGKLRPVVGLTGSWTDRPLVLKEGGHEVPGGHIVDRSLWVWAQASLTFLDRVTVDAALPVALAQTGEKPLSDLSRVSSSSLGDLRLGARVGLPLSLPLHLAAGLDVWLPTGKRGGFTSDGAARALPKALASGEVGDVVWATELGVLVRRKQDLGVLTRTGSAFHYAAAVAYRFGKLQVGPELYGRKQFQGTATSPAEALLGARWLVGGLAVGAAAGTALNDAPGAAPLRVLASVTWQPELPR